MARDSSGSQNQPQYSGAGGPADAADLSEIANYAAIVGNRKVGPTTHATPNLGRTTSTGSDVWEGLMWRDTTDGFTYEYKSGGWVFLYSGTVAYTPTFSRITPGNAVVESSYTRLGQMVNYQGSIILGSTTSMSAASGLLTLGVSYPFAAASKYGLAGSNFPLGTVGVLKTGVQNYSTAGAVSQASTTEFKLYVETGGGGANLAIHPTQPVTFAAGDMISWNIDYLAA